MTLEKWTKDSFIMGMFTGLVTLTAFYFLLTYIRSMIISYYGNPYILRPPAVHLLSMGINIILFRLLIINYKTCDLGTSGAKCDSHIKRTSANVSEVFCRGTV